MKKIVFLLILSFCTAGLSAQTDKQAKKYLDTSSEKLQQAGGVSAYFSLQIKDLRAATTESFSGVIQLQKEKFYLSVPEYSIWFNGKHQWLLATGSDEVNMSTPTAQEMQAINPSLLLQQYTQNFNYRFVGEKTDIKAKQVYEIELTPLKKNNPVQKMLIQIGKLSYLPHSITIHYKNSIQNILYVNRYETGKNFSDSLFSFDPNKHPGVEVIDLTD